jgi:hypothetical protein
VSPETEAETSTVIATWRRTISLTRMKGRLEMIETAFLETRQGYYTHGVQRKMACNDRTACVAVVIL